MALWYSETYADRVRLSLKVDRVLHSSRSRFQRIEILETAATGKTLILDGVFQTSEADEATYHEMIAHPALCTAPAIARVLVIGGGDGGTAREVLRHSEVERCTMVEIDEGVVAACQEHLPALGAWDDPRLELVIGDGVEHVAAAAAGSYDVVVLDGSDPVGPSRGLFDRRFYAAVKKCLTPGGVFALQSESPVLMPELFTAIAAALGEQFARVDPFFAPVLIYGAAQWSWTVASDAVDPRALVEDRLAAIEPGCRYYNRAIHHAALALPSELARALGRVP